MFVGKHAVRLSEAPVVKPIGLLLRYVVILIFERRAVDRITAFVLFSP